MSRNFKTWHEAHRYAATMARNIGIDYAIRKAAGLIDSGFYVAPASRNDSDYDRAEIVQPGDPIESYSFLAPDGDLE